MKNNSQQKAIILVFRASACQHLRIQHVSCVFKIVGSQRMSQIPISMFFFFPPFNFGILWSTASVILVSVYLLKTLQHLLPCLPSPKWPVEENEATDVSKNIKHRKMKGTRVLRIVGNEMIGQPWTKATADICHLG